MSSKKANTRQKTNVKKKIDLEQGEKGKMTKGSSPKAQVPTAKITSTKIAPVNLASKPKQTEVKSILVFDIGR